MSFFLQQLRTKFTDDFQRIYQVLPRRLRRCIVRVFLYIVLLACLEVFSIFSLSCLALSIAAPEKLREIGLIAHFFQTFPQIADLCADLRAFALAASLLVVLLIALKNAMSAFVGLSTSRLGEDIAAFAGETVLRQYLHSPYIAHLSGSSAATYQAIFWRTHLGQVIVHLLTVYTYAGVTLALLVALVSATPEILLLLIFFLLGFSSLLYKSLKRHIDSAGINSAEYSRKEVAAIMNAMHGIREVLIYRQQPFFFKEFQNACRAGIPARSFLFIAPPIPTWVLETAGFLVIPITLWAMFTFQDASMARITAVLSLIMLIAWRVLPMLNRSLSALVTVRGFRHAGLDCLSHVKEALENPFEEPPDPDPNFALVKDIVFDKLCFRYPAAADNCLHDLSFSIERGNCVGIIGQSGAGKSSIAAILSGLVQPSSGAFLVDGRSLTPAELAAYSLQVGYVPQTPYIMSGTLAENVAFSQWGKAWDEERVRLACRMAALDVAETRGIAMPIGENGAGLSGGQAQRLSIARALYAKPTLLILDEATSALDTAVESAIMNTIYALPQSITTVIIAHRLSTVERCDKLLWIDGGRIKASGTADVVLPRYREYLGKR